MEHKEDSFFLLRDMRSHCHSGTIIAQCSLELLGSSNPPASASQAAGPTGVQQDVQLILTFFIEMESHFFVQAVPKLLGSSNSSALASQSAGIIGVRYRAWSVHC